VSSPGIRVLLDENVPQTVAAWLSQARPDWRVSHTNEVGLSGRSDIEILQWARENCAVVITFDEDLADRRTCPLGTHCGVIRLRVWPTTVEETQAALSRLLTRAADTDIPGSLIIINQRDIRIRRLGHPTK
jgi:predicted nuclease of predicted toxin-antitoxin system